MAQGARRAMELCQADYLDINMGCPMGKVVSNGDGAALMRDPDRAARIVEAVKQAVEVPVTVKCRLGWDRGSIQVVSFAQRMQQAGCRRHCPSMAAPAPCSIPARRIGIPLKK